MEQNIFDPPYRPDESLLDLNEFRESSPNPVSLTLREETNIDELILGRNTFKLGGVSYKVSDEPGWIGDRLLNYPFANMFGVLDGEPDPTTKIHPEKASYLVVEELERIFFEYYDKQNTKQPVQELIAEALSQTSKTLEVKFPNDEYSTTATFGIFEDISATETLLHVAHIGDSRLYGVRDGVCHQLTSDHIQINKNGKILYGSLNSCKPEQLDYLQQSTVKVLPGDRFVFITKGTNPTTSTNIQAKLMMTLELPPLQASKELTQRSPDKINDRSALIVDVC